LKGFVFGDELIMFRALMLYGIMTVNMVSRLVIQLSMPPHNIKLGLIRWGIVIHGFIDGYSRLITGLRASDNNRASTVLDIFLTAAAVYGVPSRLRGDHGTENLMVAAWIEDFRGMLRGSYIWGR
jgi:uncharacterized membrane protein